MAIEEGGKSPRPKVACRVDEAKVLASEKSFFLKRLTILHFNDVYNVNGFEKEPKGGAARFRTMLLRHGARRNYDEPGESLVVFSGDAFAPSVVSTVLKGAQMPPVLDLCGIDVAMIGNHDLDFGIPRCIELTQKTSFPWLLTNASLKNDPDHRLGRAKRIHILERNGLKIGFMGLIEADWLATLATISADDVIYEDFCACAKKTALELRNDHKVDCVIALTHMRRPNDAKLAREAGDSLDVILGGHDHHYEAFFENETLVCKSGTDFKDLSKIVLEIDNKKTRVLSVERLLVDGSVEEDPEVKNVVEHFAKDVEKSLEDVIGNTAVSLDARFEAMRSSETNMGNFVTDVVRGASNADVVLINSGTFRTDAVVPAGEFTKRDLVTLLPMADHICVIQMTGSQVHAALENGVSKWPKLEGRFPQVSGLRFTFDASKPQGFRILTLHIRQHIDDSNMNDPEFVEIHPKQLYAVAIKQYMRTGKDGYDMLPTCPILVEDSLPVLQAMIANYFDRRHLQAEVASKSSLVTNGTNGAGTNHFVPISPARDGRIALVGADPVVEPLVT